MTLTRFLKGSCRTVGKPARARGCVCVWGGVGMGGIGGGIERKDGQEIEQGVGGGGGGGGGEG
jgi:hypothetical protein